MHRKKLGVMAQSVQSLPVFLVSGGAKGITAECVLKLAEYYPCHWILLGRSELVEEPVWASNCFDEAELKKRILQSFMAQGKKPSPIEIKQIYKQITSTREISKTLKTLEHLGVQADYISVDVTDAIALQEKLTSAIEHIGSIQGIIHGAGNLADKLIEKKTEQDFDSVFATKVVGLENLLRCISPNQLDYLVLFSSVAGFCGNTGQTDYALANEILNKSAHLIKQFHPSCHTVSINWGPWDSGMVTPELKKVFALRNIEVLPIETGAKMLVNELSARHHETAQVVIGCLVPPPIKEPKAELKTYRVHRKLTLRNNPFLYDHVIGDSPVLPFTCSLSWMSNIAEKLYPGYTEFVSENVRVLKGIVFDQNLANDHVMDLVELIKTDEKVILEVKIWSKNHAGKIRYHYSGKLTLVRRLPPAPVYDRLNLEPDQTISGFGKSFYENEKSSLFHGVSFQGVETVINANLEKITAKCFVSHLREKQQGQFPVLTSNPYTNDVQTHAVWIWLQHFHQSGCLPAKIDALEQFMPTPFDEPFYTSTEIKSKTETSLTIDIITHNQQGQIYSRILGAQGTIFPYKSN